MSADRPLGRESKEREGGLPPPSWEVGNFGLETGCLQGGSSTQKRKPGRGGRGELLRDARPSAMLLEEQLPASGESGLRDGVSGSSGWWAGWPFSGTLRPSTRVVPESLAGKQTGRNPSNSDLLVRKVGEGEPP